MSCDEADWEVAESAAAILEATGRTVPRERFIDSMIADIRRNRNEGVF